MGLYFYSIPEIAYKTTPTYSDIHSLLNDVQLYVTVNKSVHLSTPLMGKKSSSVFKIIIFNNIYHSSEIW